MGIYAYKKNRCISRVSIFVVVTQVIQISETVLTFHHFHMQAEILRIGYFNCSIFTMLKKMNLNCLLTSYCRNIAWSEANRSTQCHFTEDRRTFRLHDGNILRMAFSDMITMITLHIQSQVNIEGILAPAPG